MKRIIPAILIIILLMKGCGNTAVDGSSAAANGGAGQPVGQAGNGVENPDGSGTKDHKADINLGLKPNEAGKIMALMYHNVGEPEAEWVRTPANFRKDLETLYEKGYRPISLSDYVNGNITTEQGYTPVVITFDDGNLNNFEYTDSGGVKADSAVGILTDFHGKHKDFPLEATFFLYGEHPFRQDSLISKKLDFLVENGMDVGNHTKDHNSFKRAGAEELQDQIGSEAQYLESVLNKDGYKVNTLALPFGERPKDESLTKYLASGTSGGVPYENTAILNVGWNPAFSPYDKRFDHTSIPRVRASEMKVDNVGLYNYLAYFDKHPEEKFISDGQSDVVTVPEGKQANVQVPDGKEIYVYPPR